LNPPIDPVAAAPTSLNIPPHSEFLRRDLILCALDRQGAAISVTGRPHQFGSCRMEIDLRILPANSRRDISIPFDLTIRSCVPRRAALWQDISLVTPLELRYAQSCG
jgi:hypothetical protein